MSTRPLDTTDEAWAVVEEGISKMTPAERVRRSISLTVFTHRLALANIRRLHPDEDDRKHRLRLAARYIDAETMKRAFGYVDDGCTRCDRRSLGDWRIDCELRSWRAACDERHRCRGGAR